MLSGHSVGHCQFTIPVVLDEGVKTAGVHFGLQDHLAVCKIFGIYLNDSDMLAIDWRVELVKVAAVKDKITS